MKKALLAVLSVLLIAASAYVVQANPKLGAALTGAAEVGGGDPDGSGIVSVSSSPSTNRLCLGVIVDKIATPTQVTLCRGATGQTGSVIATFAGPSSLNVESAGCVDIDPAVAKDISQHPENYYVNVVNGDYPDGAIRGQLSH
jgi:hypothetical protein